MRILLAAPLRQKPHIFREHLKSVEKLIIPEGVTLDSWYIVNDCPECVPLLEERNIPFIVADTYDEYQTTETTHIWNAANLWKMHDMRNACLYYGAGNSYDAVFSVDTDLVLHPETLIWLLAADKDLVAEVFWTLSETGYTWPNAWDYDQATICSGNLDRWRVPGLYEVGGTGACFLISAKAIHAGVSYEKIPCIERALMGEDRHFCIRAQCAGFGLWLDTHAPATHLYTEECYKGYIQCLNE